MPDLAWAFDVGGASMDLEGPSDWVEPFARAWAAWASDPSGWKVRFKQVADLPASGRSLFGVLPHFEGGRCLLDAPGFAGQIDAGKGQALLRAHPAAETVDLDYFVRTAFAVRAFDQGAILVHAAGIVHRGGGYALFGQSGSGKTTAARLSKGKPVLNDDLILLRPGETGWEAWATPFGRRRAPEVCSAPLRALFRLTPASEDRLEPLPPGVALGELVANSPVVNADPERSPALLARWEEVLQAVPAALLRFCKSDTFWGMIDARSG